MKSFNMSCKSDIKKKKMCYRASAPERGQHCAVIVQKTFEII